MSNSDGEDDSTSLGRPSGWDGWHDTGVRDHTGRPQAAMKSTYLTRSEGIYAAQRGMMGRGSQKAPGHGRPARANLSVQSVTGKYRSVYLVRPDGSSSWCHSLGSCATKQSHC